VIQVSFKRNLNRNCDPTTSRNLAPSYGQHDITKMTLQRWHCTPYQRWGRTKLWYLLLVSSVGVVSVCWTLSVPPPHLKCFKQHVDGSKYRKLTPQQKCWTKMVNIKKIIPAKHQHVMIGMLPTLAFSSQHCCTKLRPQRLLSYMGVLLIIDSAW